jgi:hypothetical protein
VRLVTVDAGPLRVHVGERLAAVVRASWPAIDEETARTVGRTFARIAVSYVSTPPESDDDVAAGLAALIAPKLT